MGNYDFELDLGSQNTMSVINGWIEPESEVLEFGPANGRLTRYLTEEKKCAVTIVEIDAESGAEAKKYAKESYLGKEYGNIEKYYWTQTENRYQYIIFADVLEHLINPAQVLKRCKGLLKENGRILISIPNVTHNSIIIDMLNDKFEYDDAGLLDRTHIHFFSYASFLKMAEECGLFICDTASIYSRVGNNEIANSFEDVPIEVANYLRKRVHGSIYQYVVNLSVSDIGIVEKKTGVKGLEIEAYEQLETQCFCKESMESEYSDNKRVKKLYYENEKVCFEVELAELQGAMCLRWDPMEYNGIVLVEQKEIVLEDKSEELHIKKTNACGRAGRILIFENADPWVEFEEIPKEYVAGKMRIVFSVLAHREENFVFEKLNLVLSEVWNTDMGVILNQEQREYIEHLERDIDEQKKYIVHLEKDIQEQREYIAHLERDIVEQKGYIEHLEKDIQELKKHRKK